MPSKKLQASASPCTQVHTPPGSPQGSPRLVPNEYITNGELKGKIEAILKELSATSSKGPGQGGDKGKKASKALESSENVKDRKIQAGEPAFKKVIEA